MPARRPWPHWLTLLVGAVLAMAVILAGLMLALALRLPSTTAYGLPDDVPAYPGAIQHDGVIDRAGSAWGWHAVRIHTQPYRLPPGVDVAQVLVWYEREMSNHGWVVETGLPTAMPGPLLMISWWKGSGRPRRLAQIIITREGPTGDNFRLLIQASRSGEDR